MRKLARHAVLAATCLMVGLGGCMTFDHTVGSGAQTHEKKEEAKWFILWGLVPLGGNVDSKSLAGGATNYHVKTQYTPLDVLISFFTGFVTIHKQTVVVEK
jgi:hypothetical protein